MNPPTKRSEVIYVLEISGRPILAFSAASQREALSLRHEQWLRDDLREAQVRGAALWDGKAKLSVRTATPAETAQYSENSEPSTNGSGDLVLVYLVELEE